MPVHTGFDTLVVDARTGGEAKFPSLTAGEYLDQRQRDRAVMPTQDRIRPGKVSHATVDPSPGYGAAG